jgi:hypothetical protein
MIKFTHIEALYNVVRVVSARRRAGVSIDRVTYRGRVKLHGSNASVVVVGNDEDSRLIPQSRNRELTLGEDNYDFAAFVLDPVRANGIRELAFYMRAALELPSTQPLALFGEWIGPGLQSRVALCKLPARQWVLFAVAVQDGEQIRYFDLPSLMYSEYAGLSIFSLTDVDEYQVAIDFRTRELVEPAAAVIAEITSAVEQHCPWGARFGIDGIGEGLVWTPMDEHAGDAELFFKSKGEQHKGVAGERKPRVSVDPQALVGVVAFVDHAVTTDRLQQGLDALREQGLIVEMRNLGSFLKWVGGDVQRECVAELEASGLDWKSVAKAVNERARTWFIQAMEGDVP